MFVGSKKKKNSIVTVQMKIQSEKNTSSSTYNVGVPIRPFFGTFNPPKTGKNFWTATPVLLWTVQNFDLRKKK